jgi:hypothetical protein
MEAPGSGEERLRQLVAGRRVALVGPSRSIEGSGYGPAIDRCDLVVRLNHQWPIAPDRLTDLGRRMSILYHCCTDDYPIERLFTPEFAETRFVCYELNAGSASLVGRCELLGIPTLDVTPAYSALGARLGSPPTTGLVAIEHLLDSDVGELCLFGLTFYREPYYRGYPGHGADERHWPGGRARSTIWQHDVEAQFEHFRRLRAQDSRLRVDPRSAAVMRRAGLA